MQGRVLSASFVVAGGLILSTMAPAVVSGEDEGYAQLRGQWEVVELVDDGRVIPRDAINTWIPSSGRFEVIDNAIVFTSSVDRQSHARTFDIDATRYPCEINFREKGRLSGYGIYAFDKGQLVICAASSDSAARPADFSAPPRSRRVLMVLKRPADTTGLSGVSPPAIRTPDLPRTLPQELPPPPDLRIPAGNTGKLLTDDEVRQMLRGNWRYRDAYGDLLLTLEGNGRYHTYRETVETSAFQQVFVRAPVSSGTWVLNNGQATFQCAESVQRERVNQSFPFTVRSISDNDLIFADYRGQVGKAVKVR